MRTPNLISADDLAKWDCHAEIEDGKWVAARPLSYIGFLRRLKLAWRVFKGDYDALKWSGQ